MKLKSKNIIAPLIIGLSFLNSNSLLAGEIHSGIYEQFIIAKTPDNKIQGYFYDDNTTSKCSFFIEGKLTNKQKNSINSWQSESYSGTIEPSEYGFNLVIDNAQLYPGCMNLVMPEIATTGTEFDSIEKKKWIELVVISSDKAILRNTKDSKQKKGAYVVKKDVVGVLQYDKDSTKVEYMNHTGESFIGWINNNEFEHFKNPKN